MTHQEAYNELYRLIDTCGTEAERLGYYKTLKLPNPVQINCSNVLLMVSKLSIGDLISKTVYIDNRPLSDFSTPQLEQLCSLIKEIG